MGGDFGPRFCVSAGIEFLRSHPQHRITFVGNESAIRPLIGKEFTTRIEILHTNEVIEMTEAPGKALRSKRESSMWMALELLVEGRAQACVSSGNTGALMALSRHLVKPIEGIKRPAICKHIPTINGRSYLLDLGANLDCSAEQLLQFALMGSALARVEGRENPSTALLNVGSEKNKGSEEIQLAASLMTDNKNVLFAGFIEGDSLYDGDVDVIVCDGFVGNVALKVSEGVAKFIIGSLKKEIYSSLLKRFLSVFVRLALRGWWHRFNPSLYNGAALLGLKKVVVKSHGSSDVLGFRNAIEVAAAQVQSGIPDKLAHVLNNNKTFTSG